MPDDLLKHIQKLSDSHISYSSALEIFAECFLSVYGESSFMSLDRGNDGQGQVRLIMRSKDVLSQQFENHINDEICLDVAQLKEIMRGNEPALIQDVSPQLGQALQQHGLPSASMMAIPLYLDGNVHRWVIITGKSPGQFDNVDLEQAILVANLASIYMIRIEETRKLEAANAWIEKELADIGRIQKLLLPQENLDINGAQVATWFSPCVQAGGDYFDIINLSVLLDTQQVNTPDMWGAIIADASGHGAAAAIEIAMFDALLRTYKGSVEEGPAPVFNYTNHYFFTRSTRGAFITAMIINYQPETGKLVCCNAGHPAALLLNETGKVEFLDREIGIPVGVDPNWQWVNVEYDVKPGAVIICYTDGIIEAMSPEHEQFGLARLVSAVENTSGSAEDYRAAITTAIEKHQQSLKQSDDQALVIIKITA